MKGPTEKEKEKVTKRITERTTSDKLKLAKVRERENFCLHACVRAYTPRITMIARVNLHKLWSM